MMNDEKDRLAGFNTGYLIGKYRTPLGKQLTEGLQGVETPFFEGFVEGSELSIKEKGKEKFLDALRKDTLPPPVAKDKNKDDKEMDFEKWLYFFPDE